jgi:hypothetical protein
MNLMTIKNRDMQMLRFFLDSYFSSTLTTILSSRLNLTFSIIVFGVFNAWQYIISDKSFH